MLLDESQLKEEISFLRKTWRTKQKLASIMANKGVAVTRMKARQAFEHPSQKVTLLLDWVNAVSEFYNLKVSHIKEIVCSCIQWYVLPILSDIAEKSSEYVFMITCKGSFFEQYLSINFAG